MQYTSFARVRNCRWPFGNKKFRGTNASTGWMESTTWSPSELEHRGSETSFVLLCFQFSYAAETSLGKRRLASTCTNKIVQESFASSTICYWFLKVETEKAYHEADTCIQNHSIKWPWIFYCCNLQGNKWIGWHVLLSSPFIISRTYSLISTGYWPYRSTVALDLPTSWAKPVPFSSSDEVHTTFGRNQRHFRCMLQERYFISS